MSDFLGRMAARAVGARALAQPRLSEPPFATTGLEVVEEVVAPRAAVHRSIGLEHPAPAAPAPVTGADGGKAASAQPAAAPTGPAAEPPPAERPHSAPEPAAAASAVPAREAPFARPEAATTTAAVRATPATGSVLVASAARTAPATARAIRDDAAPVRVHIGRLEVRASLTGPPRRQPVPAPSEPEGLSLSDYLRGRRGR